MKKDTRTKAELLEEIDALNSDLDLLEKKLKSRGADRVHELENQVILWQGRAQATLALHKREARSSDRRQRAINVMAEQLAEVELLPGDFLDDLGKRISSLSGKEVVCVQCPACAKVALFENQPFSNGFLLCDDCTEKPEHWPDRWGIRRKRVDGKFTGTSRMSASWVRNGDGYALASREEAEEE